MRFDSRNLPETPDVTAADGSDVRILLSLEGGSMAHFSLATGKVSKAIVHRTVEEIWYVLGGSGQMWRKAGAAEEIVGLEAGLCITIPVGTSFQFRSTGDVALQAVAVTMPPWPGEDEAVFVDGPWDAV